MEENQPKENIDFEEIEKQEVFSEGLKEPNPDAVFVDFTPEIALNKLLSLQLANNPEKLSYTKHLAELLDIIGVDGLKKLSQIFNFYKSENEDLLRILLQQLPSVLEFIRKVYNLLYYLMYVKYSKSSYQDIVTLMIPILSFLLQNQQFEIKQEAGQQLSKIAAILNEDDRGKYILTLVLGMAHDDISEENRIVAVQLLSQMALCFGKDLCEQFVGLEFLSLGEDPQIRVRKEAVLNLISISKVVSQTFFQQKLLPFYLKAIKDMVWLVRKSCVETLVDISNSTDLKLRNQTFTPIMLNLLKDENKWVKIAAFKSLGPFIASLESPNISEKLFEYYYSMTENATKNISTENEIMYACAFNFPAVLQTGGVERWPKFLKLLQALLKSPDKKIKKTLSYSLHEIAKIIGPDRAQKDIFPILTNFLKENTDFIKNGVIKNLSSFLEIFDTQMREDLIDIFLQIQKNPHKFRIRELIAKQISHLITLYSTETIFKILVPISFKLCNDIVSAVRKAAAKQIFSFLSVFNGEGEEIYKEGVISNIKAFAVSPRFNQRQTFLIMCEKLMFQKQIFMDQFYETFKQLANDPIINVKISIAKCLYKHTRKAGPMTETDEFKNLIILLNKQNQNCKEIQVLVKKIIQVGVVNKKWQMDSLSPLLKKEAINKQEESPKQEKQEQIEVAKFQVQTVEKPEVITTDTEKKIEENVVDMKTNLLETDINSKLQNLDQNLEALQNQQIGSQQSEEIAENTENKPKN